MDKLGINSHPNFLAKSESKIILNEPFRATKLWNDCVRSFYNGMILSRHWRGLKQYENCFTASEAIEWLHNHLKLNSDFGPAVTKEQTIKLLRKFLKSGLIVEARGNKVYPDNFKDNRELFKFGNRSALKALRTPRRSPLKPIILNDNNIEFTNGSSPKLRKVVPLCKDYRGNHRKSCYENTSNERKAEELWKDVKIFSPEATDRVWKEIFCEKIEQISERLMVYGEGGTPLVPISCVNVSWIRRNMTAHNLRTNMNIDNGLKRHSSLEYLPDWILSAMKCLVSWPNSAESICNIPSYPGVEIDIFKVVRDFFANMVIPLIPFELYDSIIRVYIGSEFLDIMHRVPRNKINSRKLSYGEERGGFSSPKYETEEHCRLSSPNYEERTNSSKCDSIEDLILNMSIGGKGDSVEDLIMDMSINGKHNWTPTSQDEGILSDKRGFEKNTPDESSYLSSLQRSVKLSKLNDYTDFKDSYLYCSSSSNSTNNTSGTSDSTNRTPPTTALETLNRRTLKTLKNRSNSKKINSENLQSSLNASPSIFNKLLKTEELDNFSLPPNSCFETAFTSDSPRTRIIPQKSVDTIHLKNKLRPKSIAISSFSHNLKIYNDLSKCQKLNFSNPSNFNDSSLNRSHSEGNIENLDDNSNSSPLECSRATLSQGEQFMGQQQSYVFQKADSVITKSRFASRLRDSIKRKKAKDLSGNCRRKFNGDKYCNSSENILDVSDSENELSVLTKSSNSKDHVLKTCSIKSPDNVFANFNSSCNLKFPPRPQSNPNYFYKNMSSFPSRYSDENLFNEPSHIRSTSTTLLEHKELDGSSLKRKHHNCNRSKSVTPDACLSHSLMSSSFGNTLYLSALSGLNGTTSSDNSTHNYPPHKLYIQTTPRLPPKSYVKNKYLSESECGSLHDYENVANLTTVFSKALSCSANELSDVWADRTPFGRVPPYASGGVWRHYHSSPSKRFIGRHNGLDKLYGKKACLPGLLTKAGKEVCMEALRLILLLIEPHRRRKLQLLLRMMSMISSNEKLQLDKGLSNRALMVKTFARSVLLSERERDYDDVLAIRILTTLMDNHQFIFSPPQHLAVLVHRKINSQMERMVVESSVQSISVRGLSSSQTLAFCQQVSPDTYEKQKMTSSKQFLLELLDQIVNNPKFNEKERKKKLKEFRAHYPEIYSHRFGEDKENCVPSKPKKRLKSLKKLASIKSIARAKSFRI